ncbi:MAG: putative licABCH operon transcriptional regulator [Chloroflexota bacterium]|nr:putative licABCH operon transcriptional regulator [Chloroflexota bacterium]
MFSEKEILVISFLTNQCDWTTASVIADYLEVTPRTINNYVSWINSKYSDLIISSDKGYKVDKDRAIALLDIPDVSKIPNGYDERKKFILEKILLVRQSLSIDDFAQQLCISTLTLQKEISKIRTELAGYSLYLRIRNNHLSIIGPEKKKRQLVLNLINDELEKSSFSLESIQELFAYSQLKKIKSIVIEALKRNGYFLDDYSLLGYILHIAVFIELNRNQRGNSKDSSNQKIDFTQIAAPHVYKIIQEIFFDLKECYPGEFTLEEFFEVSFSMMTNAVSNHINKLELEQLGPLVGPEIEELLYEIVDSVRTTYSIDLKDDNFMIRFAFHLKGVITRLGNNLTIRNGQFNKIKCEFPLIYVIAVFISNIINKKTGYSLPEDEIAFIALHIGVLMEEKKAYKEKLKCIVLAPDYFTASRTLMKRLQASFSGNLVIKSIVSSIDDLENLEEFDLLLSTIELNPLEIGLNERVTYLIIDPFLSDVSVKNIFQKIEEVKSQKTRQKMVDQFKYFFRKDLFFYDQPFNTYIDAIETMCDDMMDRGYVDSNYKNEIYEHERVSPSSYGNIAIPHPLSNNAKTSVIAISINPRPIEWGNNQVNIVFMLSLQEENSEKFRDIFDFITHLMVHKDFYPKIMKSKTYDEFIDTLVSFPIS